MTKTVMRYTDVSDDGWMQSPTGEFVNYEDYARLRTALQAIAAYEPGTFRPLADEIAIHKLAKEALADAADEPTVEAVSREETEAMRRAALEPTAEPSGWLDILSFAEEPAAYVTGTVPTGPPVGDCAHPLVVASREPTAGLCPHGLPLAENTCGPCSGGRPTVNRPDPGPGTLEEIYGAGRSSGGLGDYK